MRGLIEMTGKLKRLAEKYPDQVAQGMTIEAEIEMAESKRRCPVSPVPAPPGVVPGTLRASGQVHEAEIDGKAVNVTLWYGGPGSGAEDYAVIQHEELDYFHTVGQAKYLESVLNESRSSMNGRIAKHVHFDKAKL